MTASGKARNANCGDEVSAGDSAVSCRSGMGRRSARQPSRAARSNRLQPQRADCSAKQCRQAARSRGDKRESHRCLATTPAGTATAASPPDPSNMGPPKSDAASPDATSLRPSCDLAAHCRSSNLTFRISTQQASPIAICRRRLFPIVLIPASPPPLEPRQRGCRDPRGGGSN